MSENRGLCYRCRRCGTDTRRLAPPQRCRRCGGVRFSRPGWGRQKVPPWWAANLDALTLRAEGGLPLFPPRGRRLRDRPE